MSPECSLWGNSKAPFKWNPLVHSCSNLTASACSHIGNGSQAKTQCHWCPQGRGQLRLPRVRLPFLLFRILLTKLRLQVEGTRRQKWLQKVKAARAANASSPGKGKGKGKVRCQAKVRRFPKPFWTWVGLRACRMDPRCASVMGWAIARSGQSVPSSMRVQSVLGLSQSKIAQVKSA